MPEATLILLDNSQYSINGDYPESRWNQQIQAVSALIYSKMRVSYQARVGLGLMAGRQVQILCSPTNEISKVQSLLYGIKKSGLIDLCKSLQIGALALKHRLQSQLNQKIVCFIASSVSDSKEELKLIGKKLKKNQIAVDLICIGDLSKQQQQKLNLFHEVINHQNNSQIMFINPNVTILGALTGSKILLEQGQIQHQSNDPQLALALRLSLEQAQRQNTSNVQQNNNQMDIQNEHAELQLQSLQFPLQNMNINQKNQQQNKKQDQKREKK